MLPSQNLFSGEGQEGSTDGAGSEGSVEWQRIWSRFSLTLPLTTRSWVHCCLGLKVSYQPRSPETPTMDWEEGAYGQDG